MLIEYLAGPPHEHDGTRYFTIGDGLPDGRVNRGRAAVGSLRRSQARQQGGERS